MTACGHQGIDPRAEMNLWDTLASLILALIS